MSQSPQQIIAEHFHCVTAECATCERQSFDVIDALASEGYMIISMPDLAIIDRALEDAEGFLHRKRQTINSKMFGGSEEARRKQLDDVDCEIVALAHTRKPFKERNR